MEEVNDYVIYKENLKPDQLESFEKAEKYLMGLYVLLVVVVFTVLYGYLIFFNNFVFICVLLMMIYGLSYE